MGAAGGRGEEEEGGAAQSPYRPSVSRDADGYVYIVLPMTVDKALTFIKGTNNHIVDFYTIFMPREQWRVQRNVGRSRYCAGTILGGRCSRGRGGGRGVGECSAAAGGGGRRRRR